MYLTKKYQLRKYNNFQHVAITFFIHCNNHLSLFKNENVILLTFKILKPAVLTQETYIPIIYNVNLYFVYRSIYITMETQTIIFFKGLALSTQILRKGTSFFSVYSCHAVFKKNAQISADNLLFSLCNFSIEGSLYIRTS